MASRGEHIRLEKGSLVKSHYEVVAPIGSGNFSKVYRVIDLHLPPREQRRKPLAMKVIKKEYSSDARYEKQMLIALHKNDTNRSARVSKMYECFVWQECPVFIMPIHGPSLRHRRLGLNRGVVTYEKLLDFSYDLLETMSFVHFQCHMVHTDLKPENILIADSNVAEDSMGDAWVVCDFGSASLWRMDKLDSDLISTRPYRAPEVVLGNKWHYAADMWSVGCILYEVAAGHRLFETREDLTHLHMMDRRIGRLPEAFSKHSKYSSKFFNSRGDFLSTPDVIRFSKCRLTPIRDMFKHDRDFLQLLRGLLTYNPDERMTAAEALALPMFDAIRAARKERQRQADTAVKAHPQRRSSAGAALPASGTSSQLTGRDDCNTLDFTTDDAKKCGRSNSARPDRAATPKKICTTRPSITMSATTSTDDVAAVAGTKSGFSSNVQQHHRPKRSEANISSVAGGRSVTANSAVAAAAAQREPAVTSSPNSGNQESAATSAQEEDLSSSAAPCTSELLETAQSKRRPSEVGAREARTPMGQTGSIRRSGGALPVTGVVTKEVPRPRPVVTNHRSNSFGSAALVSQLALHCVKASALASNAAATPPLSKSRQHGRNRSGRRRSSRTMSSASSHRTSTPRKNFNSGSQSGRGRRATDGGDTLLSASDPPKSPRPHTPLDLCSGGDAAKKRNGTSPHWSAAACRLETLSLAVAQSPRTPLLSSSAATPAPGNSMSMPVITTPPPQAFRTGALRSRSAASLSPRNPVTVCGPKSHCSVIAEGKADVLTGLRLGPSKAASKALSSPPSSTGATTLHWSSPSLDTPMGHQSPLQRDVTEVNINTRAEPPAISGAPDVEDESGGVHHPSEYRAETTTGDGDHGGRQMKLKAATSRAVMESDGADCAVCGSIDCKGNGRVSSSFDSATEPASSCAPSPTSHSCIGSTYNLYGSPRATDYRSPVRCRPGLETPTDNTSGKSSAIMNVRLARSGFSGNACRGAEDALGVPLTAEMTGGGQKSSAAALASPLPPSRCKLQPPQLIQRFRSSRDVSPAARSPSSRADRRSTTVSRLTSPPAVSPMKSGRATHELFSAAPLTRVQLSRSNSRSSLPVGALSAASMAPADSLSHTGSPLRCTALAVDESAPQSLTATHSAPTTRAPTSTVPMRLRRGSSSASQRAAVPIDPPKLVPSDAPETGGDAAPPVMASRRTGKLWPSPAAETSAAACACPPVGEPIRVTPEGFAANSQLPAAATRSRHLSLSEQGRLLNPNAIASPSLTGAGSTSTTAAAGAAAGLSQPLHRPHQPTHILVRSSSGERHALSEASSTTAPQPLDRYMAPGSRQLLDQAPTCSTSSPLPAITATATAAASAMTPSNSARRAGERREALRRRSSSRSVGSASTQNPRASPERSPRPPQSPSSTHVSFKAAAGRGLPQWTTATVAHASTCGNGAANDSGPSTPPFPATAVGPSRGASFQTVSLPPRNTAAPRTTSANSLRPPGDDVSVASMRASAKKAFATTPPKPTATYRQSKSPCDISPALVTTDLPSNSISGDVTSTVTLPLQMQSLGQPPSEMPLQQQSLTLPTSTVAGPSKLSPATIPRYAQAGVAPARRSMQRQASGASVVATSRPQAPGSTAAAASCRANAASVSSPTQSNTADFDAVSSVGARRNSNSAAINAINADASSGPAEFQSKHRRNPQTLRRIIVPPSSTSPLPQANHAGSSSPAAEDSDGGNEGGGEQVCGTSVVFHPPKQPYREMLPRSSVTPIPLPRAK
ncbi:hypothetical protein LSCM1_03529 [Leishmania martiniquensis]|uniref:Protein kinase domain-containing protein n=1 Tax=Leishmania martiniquensis TaxID=1580590 RepID=A0A836H5D9_9TRYP|nr:hypothetical protein LSCM1_03529 [Leishmania martiniquensis]